MAIKMKMPNGYGSISKLSGRRRKPFMVRSAGVLQPDGSYQRHIIGYYRTNKEATEALVNYNKKPLDLSKSEFYNFGNLVKRFLEEKEGVVDKSTFIRYERAIKKFSSFYNMEIRNIKYEDLQDRLNDLNNGTGLSALVVLNYIYNEALKLEIVSKNVALLLKSSKKISRTVERNVYISSDIEKIYNLSLVEDNVFVDVLLVLLYTGLRISEALEIKTNTINLEKRIFFAGKKTAAGINRVVPIHKKIEDIILKHYKISLENEKEYLFIYNNENIKTSNYKYHFYKIVNCLSQKYNIHSTRHTFISRMRELEIDIFKLKRLVGHRTNDITDSIYTHYSITSLVEIIDKFFY